MLDELLEQVRRGHSAVLVMRGEAGVGKTALLEYVAARARGCRLARVTGAQSEMELPFAGLHQLCAPMLSRAECLPVPQREALRTVFGLAEGPPPDRFLVGLAVLSLLSDVTGEQPLVCVIDDEQWLDHASAQALGFVARRLAADPVGFVFAARVPGEELTGLPELTVAGLPDADARALLGSALAGPLDARVRDLIVSETGGNPLALLELPRGLTPPSWPEGSGYPSRRRCPAASRIASGGSWMPCRARPGGYCWWRRPIRPAIRCWSGGPPGDWASPPRRQGRQRRRACWSSKSTCCSGILWCARRPTGRRRPRTGRRCTWRWRR